LVEFIFKNELEQELCSFLKMNSSKSQVHFLK